MIVDKIYGVFNNLFKLKIFNFKLFNITPGDVAEFIYKKYCSTYHNLEEIIEIKVNDQIPFKMQCNASRGYTDIKLIWDKIYEAEITQLFPLLIDSQNVFIDIGANIGYYTMLAAKSLLAKGECYAFEPVLTTFNVLNRNVEINNLSNVTTFRVAGGSEKGTLTINTIVRKKRIQKKYPTELIAVDRIDRILKIQNKDVLIKIDTEGYEFESIKGLKNITDKNRCRIIFEYTPTFYSFFNKEIFSYCNDFMYYLANNGFIIYKIGKNGIDGEISDIKSFIKLNGNLQTTLFAVNKNARE